MALTDPEVYHNDVSVKNLKKVLYAKLEKSLYGFPTSAILFYRYLLTDLQELGFVVSSYTPFVTKKL